MKKTVKITLISFGSVLAVALIVVCIALWYVFTPEKLTPIVREQLKKNINCESKLDEVELTFFSTFPNFGLKINNFTLLNRIDGSPSDTLLAVDNASATINLMSFLFKDEVILNKFFLKNGVANLYTDSLDNSNFDVFSRDTLKKDTSSFEMPDFVDFQSIKLDNVKLSYTDRKCGIASHISDLNVNLTAELNKLNGNGNINLKAKEIAFAINDTTPMSIAVKGVDLKISGDKVKSNFDGTLKTNILGLSVILDKNKFVDNQDIAINLPLKADVDSLKVIINQGLIEVKNSKVNLNGWLQKKQEGIDMDIDFISNLLNINDIIALLPENIRSTFAAMKFDGVFNLKGNAIGSGMPVITADVNLQNGKFELKDLPYKLRDINGNLAANIDLSENGKSELKINRVDFKTRNSSAVVKGRIDDLTGKMLCNMNLDGKIDLADAAPMLSDSMQINGLADANLHGIFTIDQITNSEFKDIKFAGTLKTLNLNFTYNDTTKIFANQADITLQIPSNQAKAPFFELLQAVIKAPEINFEMVGSMSAKLSNSTLDVGISDITNDKQPFAVVCDYDMNNLSIKMDTITANISSPKGCLAMLPLQSNRELYTYDITMNSRQLQADMGRNMGVSATDVSIKGGTTIDEKQTNVMSKYSPNLQVRINNIHINTDNIAQKVFIPMIDLSITPQNATINKSRFVIDNSDFNLSGTISNIDNYFQNEAMLTAKFDFVSDKVDVLELRELISGFGAKDTIQQAAIAEKPLDGTQDPFMVPYNVDITLNTRVSHGKIAKTDIYDLGGTLTIKNGILVIEQMGFTCDAAKMQLTAIYRSERKNHLFAGIDFHLLDIDVHKLLDMIPQIDSIVPMLKYFDGKGEFHLACETYMKSNYDLKYSTIRGASAFNGKNLILKDNEPMKQIQKAMDIIDLQRKVDSLDVELTVLRNEVELYPFLLSMGKYRLMMQGKYFLGTNGMVSLYKGYGEMISPLRLGLEISSDENGNFKKPSIFKNIKIFGLKYGSFLQPSKTSPVEEQVLHLKSIILEALKRNVKPQE